MHCQESLTQAPGTLVFIRLNEPYITWECSRKFVYSKKRRGANFCSTLFEGDAFSRTQVSIAFEALSHCGFVASTGEGSVPLVLSAALNGGQRWW